MERTYGSSVSLTGPDAQSWKSVLIWTITSHFFPKYRTNPKQFCLYLEKSFFSRNRYCLERGDANELSSGPDGSGNLLICHTHCVHRSSSTSLSWKPSKTGRKPELGSNKPLDSSSILLTTQNLVQRFLGPDIFQTTSCARVWSLEIGDNLEWSNTFKILQKYPRPKSEVQGTFLRGQDGGSHVYKFDVFSFFSKCKVFVLKDMKRMLFLIPVNRRLPVIIAYLHKYAN